MKKLAILGTGNMANAIIGGLISKNKIQPSQVIAIDPYQDSLEKFCATHKVNKGTKEDISCCDTVILAFKPQGLEEASGMYKDYIRGQRVISILAGVTVSRLSEAFPEGVIVRTMPNLALSVGRSATAIYSENKEAAQEAAELFEQLGRVVFTQEEDISKVTALSGSGPAYICYLAEQMVNAAIEDGMDKETALVLCKETFIGTVRILESEEGFAPEELRAKITSKKGTTEAGINSMKESGFEEAVKKGYLAAKNRSDELSKI